jgi:predicted transcriptional regulator
MLGVRIDDDTERRLVALAERTHRSKSYHAKEAIRRYIEQEEAQERIKQDTLARWKAYQETGAGVSDEAVTAWLDSWGEDNEQPCPVK